MDETKLVEALAALTAGQGRRTKMGVLRALLPLIESAQAAGVPHEEIWKELKEHGLDVSLSAYSVMLTRARAQARAQRAKAELVPTATAQVEVVQPQTVAPPAEAQPAGFQAAESDPFGVIPNKDAVSKKFESYSSNKLLNRKKTGES
ncbi:hypothetical protein ACU4GI_33075 [Cupriavidus basilensis]